jgi:hypothetical protein
MLVLRSSVRSDIESVEQLFLVGWHEKGKTQPNVTPDSTYDGATKPSAGLEKESLAS